MTNQNLSAKYKVFIYENKSALATKIIMYDQLSSAIRFAKNMWYAGHRAIIKDTMQNRIIKQYPKY